MRKLLFLILYVLPVVVQAQPGFVRDTSIVVKVNGKVLKNPWGGGFNCPQFSAIDLNGDGIKDLFVFDRSGNTVSTFINKGTPGKVDYVYAPQYEARFPPMHDYALLADYDCDGKEDIFTATNGGIMVYRNAYNSTDGLIFKLVKPLIYSNYYNQYNLNLYASVVNIPAFADMDNDGDLDILTIEVAGSYVEYHKNMSKELYNSCDSLVFQYQQECWGHITCSNSNNTVTLDAQCSGRRGVFDNSARVLHSGTTLLAYDDNGDGVKDALMGDLVGTNLLALHNGGTVVNAHITSVIDSFPAGTTPANILSFPAAYMLDVDNDGLKDLLVAPNQLGASENTRSAWLYKNVGTNTTPRFVFQTKSFLQEDMIDVGEGAAPAFFDANGDGLQDLLVGTRGYFNNGQYQSGITLYKNTGTLTQPEFSLVTTDYSSIAATGLNSIVPTFGDIDGDGDLDMIVGESLGKLYLFTNTAGAGNPASFSTPQAYSGIDAGSYSVPQLVDVDKDGLLDLLVGSQNGAIAYYRNMGSRGHANFVLDTNALGGVDVRRYYYDLTGYCSPLLFNCAGQSYLLCGTEDGHLYAYNNIDNNLNGTFTRTDTALQNIYVGGRSLISAGDINNDGKPDLVVGNYDGGVAIYLQTGNCTIDNTLGVYDLKKPFSINITPNPASETIVVSAAATIRKVQFTDLLGRVQNITFLPNETGKIAVNTGNWSNGVYICVVILDNGSTATRKVIICH